ncbi:MAG: TIGR04053 family radical SAM/SPASM domain-containing protein [Halobacteriales archaeon]
MRPPRVDTDQRPLVLIWEVTQACELACKHCRADATPTRHPDELSTEEGKVLLDSARAFGENQLVVLSGGDPLKRDDLPTLIEYGTDQGLRMTLTPSGTGSLTASNIRALSDAGMQRLALSLDGATADAHDTFRGEPGSFEQTMTAAEAASDADIPLQINTTVCAETVDELPAIRDVVTELGAVLWSVFFLVPIGRGRVLDPIDSERSETVMEWLATVAEDTPFGIKTTEAPHYRRVKLQRGNDDRSVSENKDQSARIPGITAGDGFAFVSHTGEVYPSGFLPQSAGNISNRDLVDIYRNTELFTDLRNPDALSGKCGACPFKTVCGGSRSRAYAYTGDPLASDPLCPFVPPDYEGPMPEQSLS